MTRLSWISIFFAFSFLVSCSKSADELTLSLDADDLTAEERNGVAAFVVIVSGVSSGEQRLFPEECLGRNASDEVCLVGEGCGFSVSDEAFALNLPYGSDDEPIFPEDESIDIVGCALNSNSEFVAGATVTVTNRKGSAGSLVLSSADTSCDALPTVEASCEP